MRHFNMLTWYRNAGNSSLEDLYFKAFPGEDSLSPPYKALPLVLLLPNPVSTAPQVASYAEILLGSSHNLCGKEDSVTSTKNVCVLKEATPQA